MPGEQLCLATSADDCQSTYTVQADDDCDKITKMAGVNSTILTLNNPQIDQECGNLYIGEVCLQVKAIVSTY